MPPENARARLAAGLRASLSPRRLSRAEAAVIAGYAEDYTRAMTVLWSSPGGTLEDAQALRGAFLSGVRAVTNRGRRGGRRGPLSASEVQALALVADGLAASAIEAAAHPVTPSWRERKQRRRAS